MNRIIIKQSKPDSGRDNKTFRAYSVAMLPGGSEDPLGISLSSTSDPTSIGAMACAVKAFIKLVEPKAERAEIETRIRLSQIERGRFEAELQPKSPCDLTNPMHNCTWISAEMALPDSEQSVLVHSPDADEPVWLGFHDGECWRWVSAEPIETKVTHWMAIPEPPEA